jgi:hypothetical protein
MLIGLLIVIIALVLLVAGPMGYHELEFFEAAAGERELPKVTF